MMKQLLSFAVLLVALSGLCGPAGDALVARCEDHYRALLEAMKDQPADKIPRSWEKGKYKMVAPEDWCSGFVPGSLWYLYELTGKEAWKTAAADWTEKLIEPLRHDANNHDVGFRTYCSAGNGLRLTGDARYAAFLHDTSAALRTRYDDNLGLIRSWNNWAGTTEKDYFRPSFIVIIDNMMNLELLEWDAKNGGDPKSDVIARSQADKTDAHHFRPDGSPYHILGYNPKNGKIHGIYAGQGASVDGTWARGQAWAIYGFTVMYRETKDKRYLDRAVKAVDYWLNEPNLPLDGVPYWDFKAADIPNEERDVSAACVTLSALCELMDDVPADLAAKYRAYVRKTLAALASPAYFAAPGENGSFLLKHSVGCRPHGSEVDVPLNYADYYFLETLVRSRKKGILD